MSDLHEEKIKELEALANDIRIATIESLIEAKSGHTAGPLGMADVFTAMYFYILRHDPKDPKWEDRDRLILSNGHICPVLYATMAYAGYFPKEDLKTLRKLNSPLQGHPHREWFPFAEISSGPLGSGLSQAVGMTLADRMDRGESSDRFFYCLMSDGELEAGQTWEAFMLGGKEKLRNLIAVIDRNNIQIEGFTEDIMPLEPLRKKFEAFNWHVLEVDGHNIEEIIDAVDEAKAIFEKPKVIIAHTIPGKGVSFIERRPAWHGVPPGQGPEDIVSKSEQGERALDELRKLGEKLRNEHNLIK